MTKHSPFSYFKTSPEVIRLAVMMYVRFPLSLRNVEDLLHERGVDRSQRWSSGAVERWSNFHVTYATPSRCKTPFPNCTIIYIVKQRVIYVVFVSVYLLHLLHLSPLIGTKSAQRRLAPPLRSPLFSPWGAIAPRAAQARTSSCPCSRRR
jgi:hypothetical protein